MPDHIDYAEKLLRGEIAAVESYERALEDLEGEDQHPKRAREAREALASILDEHRSTRSALRDHLARTDGDPDQGAGAWGAYVKAVEKVSAWIGDAELLEAMKQGEIHGLSEYRTALASKALPAELETLIREELLPRQQEHVAILDRLIAGTPG